MTSYNKLKAHTWFDLPVLILGSGPTLSCYDFSKCVDCHIITVNSSILKVNWSSKCKDGIFRAWISNDSLCMRWSYFDKVRNDICHKIVRDSWSKYKNELKDFLFFKPRNSREDIINEGDDGLLYNSSIPSAIDLSVKLGFKNIFLFGIDHVLHGGKTHFWQYLPIHSQPKESINNNGKSLLLSPKRIMQPIPLQQNVWNMNIDVFASIDQYAHKNNASIVNVNNYKTKIPFIHKNFNEAGVNKYGVEYVSVPGLS